MYGHGAIMLFCCTTIVQVLEVSEQVDVHATNSQFGHRLGKDKSPYRACKIQAFTYVIILEISFKNE